MQWDYAGCGIDAVFSGHVHNYERLYKGGVVYVVNGAGGTFKALAGYVNPPLSISQKRITDAYGFMTAHEGKGKITFTYHSVPPQASLPYEKQKYTQSDCFTLLNKGTLTTSVEMERPNSIIVTKGGGTIDLNGFDSSFSNKLQGVGRLIKQGNGTLSFDGKNPDFTGTLQLKKGALRLASEDVLSREVALVGDGGILIVEGGCHSFDTPLELRKSLELDLQAPRLVFGDSSNARWSSSAILWLRGDLSPRSLCFGSHSSGLTRKQLSRIRLKSHPHLRFDRLDEEGYLLSPVSEQAHVPGQGFPTTDIRSLA
jgi:autotransporter-associated beta strand protein